MDDRELLELAARAAGIRYDKEASKPHLTSGAFFGLWLKIYGEPYEGQRRRWNAMTDDGDALRLAVALGIDLLFTPEDVEAVATQHARKEDQEMIYPWACESWTLKEQDPNAATRRAIVRAAAEIGKAMQEKTPPAGASGAKGRTLSGTTLETTGNLFQE